MTHGSTGGGGGGLGGLNPPPPLGLPSKNLMCIEKRHHYVQTHTVCSYSSVSVQIENLAQLREMILLQEFKRSVRQDVRLHLEEQRVETLDEAARIADDYALTHKHTYKMYNDAQKSKNWNQNKKTGASEQKDENTPVMQSQQESTSTQKPIVCYKCRKPGHIKPNCPLLQHKKTEPDAHPNALVKNVAHSHSERIQLVDMD